MRKYISKIVESKDKKLCLCFWLSWKFQGIGLLISFDNPIVYDDYLLVDFRFLFVKIWFRNSLFLN